MASCRLPSVLALEIKTAQWPSKDPVGNPSAHSRDEFSPIHCGAHHGYMASFSRSASMSDKPPLQSISRGEGDRRPKGGRRFLIITPTASRRWTYSWFRQSHSIRDRPTAPRSPWQNGYCERAIGSIRRECLDHVVVFGERHLRHLLRSYATYCNSARTHLSINKDAPSRRTVHAVGRILPTPILGGLHHLYVRV